MGFERYTIWILTQPVFIYKCQQTLGFGIKSSFYPKFMWHQSLCDTKVYDPKVYTEYRRHQFRVLNVLHKRSPLTCIKNIPQGNNSIKISIISQRIIRSFGCDQHFVNSAVFRVREKGQFFFKFFNNFWCNFGLQIFYPLTLIRIDPPLLI